MIGIGAIFAQYPDNPSGATQLSTPILSTTVQSNGAVLLQSSNVTNADGYVFERSPDEFFDVSGNITEVADSSARTISDGGLSFGQTYFYRVKAKDSGATYLDSNYSTIKQVDVNILESPTLSATSGDAQVSLSWTTVLNATQYLVQRDTNSSFTSPTNVYSSSGLSTVSTGLTNGTTYYFRVKAQGIGIADSEYSTTVSATPQSSTTLPTFTADILDSLSFSPRFWYGVVRGTSSYTGNCLRVRRASDNSETDIQYCGGFIHEQQVEEFCGSSDGYVVTLYDNVNGYDITNTDTTKQPKIYDGTTQQVLRDSYGNVTMYFDGVDDVLESTVFVPSIFTNNALVSIFTVVEPISFNDTIQEAYVYANGGSSYQMYAAAIDSQYLGIRPDNGPNVNNYIGNHGGSVLFKPLVASHRLTAADAISETSVEIYQNNSTLSVSDAGSTRTFLVSGRIALGNELESYISVHTDFDEQLSTLDFETLRDYLVSSFVTNKNINSDTYLQNCSIPQPEDPAYTGWTNEAISNGYDVPSTPWAELYKILFSNFENYNISPSAYYGFRHDGSKEFSFINVFDATGAKATDTGHAVTWSSGAGIDTNGTGYLDLNRTLASLTTHTQNDASIFVFARNISNDDGYIFGAFDGSNITELKDVSGGVEYALNGGSVTTTKTLTDGTLEISRNVSSELALVIDGVVSDISSDTSTGVPTVNLYLGAKNNNGSATGITDCVFDHLLICPNETGNSDIIRALFINFNNDANLL